MDCTTESSSMASSSSVVASGLEAGGSGYACVPGALVDAGSQGCAAAGGTAGAVVISLAECGLVWPRCCGWRGSGGQAKGCLGPCQEGSC